MIAVWLCRYVEVARGKGGVFKRAVQLPFAPYPGLGLIIQDGQDPVDVEWVYINGKGAVIVKLPDRVYDNLPPEHQESQWEYEISGWATCDHNDCLSMYYIVPPQDSDLKPIREGD